METDEEEMQHLENLTDKLGGFGRFQYVMFLGMYTVYCIHGWSMVQMIYAGMVPPWRCVTSHELFQEEKSGQFNDSFSYNGLIEDNLASTTNMAWPVPDFISGNNETTLNVCSVNGTRCAMFVFLTYSRTIINEWNLVCDLKWVKQVVISVQMCGLWVGVVLAGQLGDRYGRRKPLYSFVLCHVVLNIIAGFSVSWQMFAICRFLIGMQTGGFSVIAYPYSLELYPDKSRTLLGFCPLYAIGACIYSGAAFLLDNWSHLHFACAAINSLHLLGWFYFPDSIRWLAVHGRLEEAMEAANKIARLNRKPVPDGTMSLLKKIAQEEQEIRQNGKAYSYLDLFKNAHVRKVTLIICYFVFSVTIVYYGISYGLSSFDGNIFLNLFLYHAMCVLSSLLLVLAAHKLKRRTWTLIFLTLTLTASAGCILASLVLATELAGTVINGLSLSANTLSYLLWNTVALWGLELLPTVVRNLGRAYLSSASKAAAIVLPFIINFDESIIVPYIVITVLLCVFFILCFFLPETRGQVLADSMTRTVVVDANKISYSVVEDVDQPDTGQPAVAENGRGSVSRDHNCPEGQRFLS